MPLFSRLVITSTLSKKNSGIAAVLWDGRPFCQIARRLHIWDSITHFTCGCDQNVSCLKRVQACCWFWYYLGEISTIWLSRYHFKIRFCCWLLNQKGPLLFSLWFSSSPWWRQNGTPYPFLLSDFVVNKLFSMIWFWLTSR